MNLPNWLWWGGGGIAAIGAFLLLSRFFGWRIGAIAAAIIAGLAFWKGSMTRAEKRGRDAQEARQQEIAREQVRRANEARQREIDRQRQTGGALNEEDPFLRD